MAVLDLPDAKAHLNITSTTHDAELPLFIAAAEAAVAKRVGPLEPTEVTERVRGGCAALSLSTLPVLEVTEVTDAGGGTVDVADLYVSDGLVVREDGGGFASRWYDVTYSAGRAVDALPADLLQAVKELLRHLWRTQRGAVSGPGQDFDPTSIDPHTLATPGFA